MTGRAESKNTNVTFRSAQECITKEKISLNVSCLVVNPACRAGVQLPVQISMLGEA